MTNAVLSTVVPRKSTGEWICGGHSGGQGAETAAVRGKGAARARTPSVWAYLGLIKSLQQRSQHRVQGFSTSSARLEHLLPNQICDEARFCRLDETYKADVKRITLNIASPENGCSLPRSRSTRSNRGRAQIRTSSTHSHGTRATDVSGRSPEDVKIMVKAFLKEACSQTAWRGTTPCRASTCNVWQSLTHIDQSEGESGRRLSGQGQRCDTRLQTRGLACLIRENVLDDTRVGLSLAPELLVKRT